MASADTTPRAFCYRCHKPAALCLCARIEPVHNRTNVLVVQHRSERFHAVGTARLVRLGLRSSHVCAHAVETPPPELDSGAVLLFPGREARELSSLAAHERPSQLVLLDGTWRKARWMIRETPWLQRLPQVRFTPTELSRYRIRQQPAEHCVSTLESAVATLRILEPDTTGLERLLTVFDSMIDDQIAFMRKQTGHPRFGGRPPRTSRVLPAALRDRPEDALMVYGDTTPLRTPTATRRRQLVRWTAVRPTTGEVFDRVVRPEHPPTSPAHLAHLGLAPSAFEAALTWDETVRQWSAFRRDADVILAWHPAQLTMAAWLQPDATGFALKILWSNHSGARCGKLEDLVDRLGLDVPTLPIPGRAGVRLAHALAVARHLAHVAPPMARSRVSG